jgi:hypothetical protein
LGVSVASVDESVGPADAEASLRLIADLQAPRVRCWRMGALLSHSTTIDSMTTPSYGFTTLDVGGALLRDEIPVFEAEQHATPMLFGWHATGFGLFYSQREGEQARVCYQEIRCLR